MSRDLSADEAKEEIIKQVTQGKSIKDSLIIVDKSLKTYEYYRRTDKDFANAIDRARTLIARGKGNLPQVEVPDFPEFSEKYLHNKLFQHQLQWFDMLEGREPRDLHPSMTYEDGRETRLIINTPPGHAKSTTITANYVIWRIVKNPDIKIIIVSKAQRLAEQFILQIKERLTSNDYVDLQTDFAPAGGWKDGSVSWKANQFYVGGRSSEAKDPTVQAVGMRGQVYGARADLIIVDDAVDNNNFSEYDKQIDWLLGVVASRLAPRTGRLLIIGTRLAAKDLYSELRDPNRYYGGTQPWKYLLQPAVLEYAEEPKDWVTLWPYSDRASDPDDIPNADGLYDRWTGETLKDVRDSMPPAQWSRIYQQEQVSEDSIFKPDLVTAACQARAAGRIPDNDTLGRAGGMEGLRIIAGIDPAAVGYTAAVCLGIDIKTGIRYIIDVYNSPKNRPDETRDLIKSWTERYDIKEWRVEGNAFQRFLTQDREINEYLAARGVLFTEHITTGANKHDPNFGVMAMATLFDNDLIKLPNSSTQNIKSMIEQLITWQPDMSKKIKTDIVMAMWFAELRAQELVLRNNRSTIYRNNSFTTRADKSKRILINSNFIN